MHQALDLMHIIRRGHAARAGAVEVLQAMDTGQIFFCQAQIVRPQCRMRLVTHIGLDADFIDAVGNMLRFGIGRQMAAASIQITYLRHRARRQWHQLVRAFQIMILQRRRVDMRQELVLVLAVGLRRIEVFGTFGERGVEDVLALIRCRVGVVPQRAITAGEQQT